MHSTLPSCAALLLLNVPFSSQGPAAAQDAPTERADARPRRTHRTQLFDPSGPGCVLWRPGQDPRTARLPAPVAARRLSEMFGPGVTTVALANGLVPDPERPPKKLLGASGAAFLVVYTDPTGEGFWDPTLGPMRRAAFEHAGQVLVSMIEDDNIVISADASMPALGTVDKPLASGAASAYWMDSDFPFPDSWYGEPLASHLDDADPDTDTLDIKILFNSSWDSSTTPFYYGLDSATGPSQVHFVTTALHELTHGLDFASSFTDTGGLKLDDPAAFDQFLIDAAGNSLIALPDVPSTTSGDDVFWNGGVGKLCWQKHFGQGGSPPIYAPTPYEPGSSIDHWDEAAFQAPWDLMSPEATMGGALTIPDDVTRGLLTDLGWSIDFEAVYATPVPSDVETGKPQNPFSSLPNALADAATSGKTKLYLGAGTYDISGLTISQPVVLRPWPGGAVIR